MGGDSSIAVLDQPLRSAPDARADFLLLRQKKVAKEKATPRYAVGFADSPALLSKPGGCATRGDAPQTVLADFPRLASVARRCTRGRSNRTVHYRKRLKYRSVFLMPFASSSSAGRNGKRGEDCLRAAGPSSAAPVAHEQRRAPGEAGRRGGRAFFLATFSWQDKKKYARASGAETSASATTDARAHKQPTEIFRRLRQH